MSAPFSFDNSYARLPERFYSRLHPAPVRNPALVKLNLSLAGELGLDPEALASPEGVAMLAGNRIAEGAEPIALAYAGHQFGHFVPQLGDGRAILLGEVIDRAGRRRDLQLKGSGPTPYSRRGDGRAALGPVLREYLVSEAMQALGIPTTRSLAAVATGERVYRETALPGAVLTRVALSHVRVGTFQYFAARNDHEALRLLAEHVIARHYPEAALAENPPLALLRAVVAAQARLVAQWLGVGFIHGVMNTDNMSIAGETIDYGPCAFMDAYDPGAVFSAIDQYGRYAYANQPQIAQWNLARLAEALLPLLHPEREAAIAMADEAVAGFAAAFNPAFRDTFRRKLGLDEERADDVALIQDLLTAMHRGEADFTLTFRLLADEALCAHHPAGPRSQFIDPTLFDLWAARWRDRQAQEERQPAPAERARRLKAANPAFIPRNHRIEAALAAAVDSNDYAPFERLLAILSHPYDDQPDHAGFMQPPAPSERIEATFCGT